MSVSGRSFSLSSSLEASSLGLSGSFVSSFAMFLILYTLPLRARNSLRYVVISRSSFTSVRKITSRPRVFAASVYGEVRHSSIKVQDIMYMSFWYAGIASTYSWSV